MKANKALFIKIIILTALLMFLFLILFISGMNIKANNKAVKYFNKGKFEEAAEVFNKEIKNNPGNYDILINSAGTDYKLNKLDEAQTKYAAVVNSTDIVKEDKFAVFYDMGNVEFKKNNFEEAVDFYKEALKLNPNDKDTKYNLEAALLKLSEKNDQQDNKNSNKQNDKQNEKQESDKQKQQEQDLKKQMEQNNKDQKENEKKRQEESVKNADSQKSDDEKQKELEKEKKELDKQKKEISDKIKDLMKAQKNKEQSKQNNSSKEEKLQENKQEDKNESIQQNQMKKDDNKDIQTTMFLNYYNEADKNSNKLRSENKEPLVNQPQEDW